MLLWNNGDDDIDELRLVYSFSFSLDHEELT